MQRRFNSASECKNKSDVDMTDLLDHPANCLGCEHNKKIAGGYDECSETSCPRGFFMPRDY